jgi:hypothetical protein
MGLRFGEIRERQSYEPCLNYALRARVVVGRLRNSCKYAAVYYHCLFHKKMADIEQNTDTHACSQRVSGQLAMLYFKQ